MAEKWVILRCATRQTLRLAEAVRGEGVEAWTPTEVSRPKIPKRRARITLCEPILPRFVFADASCLLELLSMSHRPLAGFSVLCDGSRYVVVKDNALDDSKAGKAKREDWELSNFVEITNSRNDQGSGCEGGSMLMTTGALSSSAVLKGRPPQRKRPDDFDVIFVEQGRVECERWYRASRITVNRWMDEAGGPSD
jgi:hypothetical protein